MVRICLEGGDACALIDVGCPETAVVATPFHVTVTPSALARRLYSPCSVESVELDWDLNVGAPDCLVPTEDYRERYDDGGIIVCVEGAPSVGIFMVRITAVLATERGSIEAGSEAGLYAFALEGLPDPDYLICD